MKKLIYFFLFNNLGLYAQRTEVKYGYRDNYNIPKALWTQNPDVIKEVRIFDRNNRITEEYHKIINGFEKERYYSKSTYDIKGHLIEQKTSNGDPYFKSVDVIQWQYTDFDSLSLYRRSFENDNLKEEIISFEERRTYDSKHRLSETITLNNSQSKPNTLQITSDENYRYFDNDLLSERNDGKVITNYFYDVQKRLIKVEINQKVYPYESLRTAYIYNNKNQLIEEINSKIDDKTKQWLVQRKLEYEYDDNGNQNVTTNYLISYKGELDIFYRKNYIFDERRRIIKYSTYFFDKKLQDFYLTYQQDIFYNNTGLVEKFVFLTSDYSGNLQASTYTYKYDDKNRVIYSFTDSAYDDDIVKQTIYRFRYTYEDLENPPLNSFDSYVIYPNPTNDMITIDNTLSDNCLTEVTLNDISGRFLINFLPNDFSYSTFDENRNLCVWQLKIPDSIQNGTYLVVMKNGNGQSIGKKIVVNR
jgi:Secretion system C-terminal sorting domain